MAKPKAKRGRRGRGRRPLAPPGPRPGPPPVQRLAPSGVAALSAPARADEPSVTRFSERDYGYVRRDFQRIALLATAIIVTIVILSFFLP